MKRLVGGLLLAIVVLVVGGCGGGSSTPPNIVTQILSDPTFDGDITKSPGGTFTIAQRNTQFLLAGIDPVAGESRAFLDFPLGGTGGVPLNAVIVSATLDIRINSYLSSAGSLPMRIELVSFPASLSAADYDSTPLVTTVVTFPVFPSDALQHVAVNVTSLMVEAQRLGLQNFQVRIMEDFGTVPNGIIEINDTTGPNSATLAPLLEVTYY